LPTLQLINRKLETREKILNAAGNLFIREGLKSITMDTIALKLGVSKRTIYENFTSKEELIREFLLENMLKHKNELLSIVNRSENVIEALIQFGEYNREIFSKYNPLFFEDLKKYYAQLFDSTVDDSRVKNYEVSYLILKKGVNEGTFLKSIDIDIANRFIHNTMDFFYKLNQSTHLPHAKIWQTVFLPYIRGICTEKGLEVLKAISAVEGN